MLHFLLYLLHFFPFLFSFPFSVHFQCKYSWSVFSRVHLLHMLPLVISQGRLNIFLQHFFPVLQLKSDFAVKNNLIWRVCVMLREASVICCYLNGFFHEYRVDRQQTDSSQQTDLYSSSSSKWLPLWHRLGLIVKNCFVWFRVENVGVSKSLNPRTFLKNSKIWAGMARFVCTEVFLRFRPHWSSVWLPGSSLKCLDRISFLSWVQGMSPKEKPDAQAELY